MPAFAAERRLMDRAATRRAVAGVVLVWSIALPIDYSEEETFTGEEAETRSRS